MRAFINAIPGVYRNAQYSLSEEGFNELGIETVMFFSKEEVVDMQRGDILISTKRLVGKRLEELGAMPELDTHPPSSSPS